MFVKNVKNLVQNVLLIQIVQNAHINIFLHLMKICVPENAFKGPSQAKIIKTHAQNVMINARYAQI